MSSTQCLTVTRCITDRGLAARPRVMAIVELFMAQCVINLMALHLTAIVTVFKMYTDLCVTSSYRSWTILFQLLQHKLNNFPRDPFKRSGCRNTKIFSLFIFIIASITLFSSCELFYMCESNRSSMSVQVIPSDVKYYSR